MTTVTHLLSLQLESAVSAATAEIAEQVVLNPKVARTMVSATPVDVASYHYCHAGKLVGVVTVANDAWLELALVSLATIR